MTNPWERLLRSRCLPPREPRPARARRRQCHPPLLFVVGAVASVAPHFRVVVRCKWLASPGAETHRPARKLRGCVRCCRTRRFSHLFRCCRRLGELDLVKRGVRLVSSFHCSNQICNHLGERFIAGCDFNNLLPRCGMWPGAAVHIDGNGFHHLVPDSGLEATETDVSRFVISASCRTSRPVHPHRCPIRTQPLFQSTRQLCRMSLGVDLREIAVVRSRAGYEAAPECGWRRRKLLQEVFFQKIGNAFNRHVGQNGVLSGCETYLPVSVIVYEAGQFVHLSRMNSSLGYAQSDGSKARLLLPSHSQMITVMAAAHISSR